MCTLFHLIYTALQNVGVISAAPCIYIYTHTHTSNILLYKTECLKIWTFHNANNKIFLSIFLLYKQKQFTIFHLPSDGQFSKLMLYVAVSCTVLCVLLSAVQQIVLIAADFINRNEMKGMNLWTVGVKWRGGGLMEFDVRVGGGRSYTETWQLLIIKRCL